MADPQSQQLSPFLKLSPELRRLVFQHLFDEISESITLSMQEALPFLEESLATKRLIFDGCDDHFPEGDDPPRTWILEQYGSLFKETEWDVTWAHRLLILINAFPNLRRVTLLGHEGYLSGREAQPEYWLQRHNGDELWEMWKEGSRFDSEPNDTGACNAFLQDQEKTFAFEALVDFMGYRESDLMVSFDLKTGKVISKEAKE